MREGYVLDLGYGCGLAEHSQLLMESLSLSLSLTRQLSAYFLIKTLPFWAQLNGECGEGSGGERLACNMVTHFATCNCRKFAC